MSTEPRQGRRHTPFAARQRSPQELADALSRLAAETIDPPRRKRTAGTPATGASFMEPAVAAEDDDRAPRDRKAPRDPAAPLDRNAPEPDAFAHVEPERAPEPEPTDPRAEWAPAAREIRSPEPPDSSSGLVIGSPVGLPESRAEDPNGKPSARAAASRERTSRSAGPRRPVGRAFAQRAAIRRSPRARAGLRGPLARRPWLLARRPWLLAVGLVALVALVIELSSGGTGSTHRGATAASLSSASHQAQSPRSAATASPGSSSAPRVTTPAKSGHHAHAKHHVRANDRALVNHRARHLRRHHRRHHGHRRRRTRA